MVTRKISDKSHFDKDKNPKESINLPRRHFLAVAGTVVVEVGMGGGLSALAEASPALIQLKSKDGVPVSTGYILVDTRKCQGCVSCMIACSLVNEGESNLSLSRIQVLQNSFESFPDDISIEQCRQCVDPECLKVCPMKAISADPENGFVRQVDTTKCIGCGYCIEACPFVPSRPVVVPDKHQNGDNISRKCDLCAGARYHWDAKGGGPSGIQACVAVCPVQAIRFTNQVPVQEGDSGYKVNLRGYNWSRLGY
jgi:protein NrfC